MLQTTTGSEERIQALLRNANTRLLAHSESRRRLLQLKAPAVLVPYQGRSSGDAVCVHGRGRFHAKNKTSIRKPGMLKGPQEASADYQFCTPHAPPDRTRPLQLRCSYGGGRHQHCAIQ